MLNPSNLPDFTVLKIMEEVTIFLSDIFHSSVKFNIVISILFSDNYVVGLSYSTDH